MAAARIQAESQLTPEQQKQVWAQFRQLGTDRLGPIYEALGQRIPYPELRLLRLYLMPGDELEE